MFLKNLSLTNRMLNIKKIIFPQKNYCKTNKLIKHKVKLSAFAGSITHPKMPLTNVIGWGVKNSMNDQSLIQFALNKKLKRKKKTYRSKKKKPFLLWKKSLAEIKLTKKKLKRLITTQRILHHSTLIKFALFICTYNVYHNQLNRKKIKNKKYPWVPKHYHLFFQKLLKKKHTHTTFAKKQLTSPKPLKWFFIKNTNLRFTSNLTIYNDYRSFVNWDNYSNIYRPQQRIKKKMLWFNKLKKRIKKKKKLSKKFTYGSVLRHNLRKKKILPKSVKTSILLTRLVTHRRLRKWDKKKKFYGKIFLRNATFYVPQTIKYTSKSKIPSIIKFKLPKKGIKTLKQKWLQRTKTQFHHRAKKAIFKKNSKRFFIKKEISVISFLLRQKLIIPADLNLPVSKFPKKRYKRRNRISKKNLEKQAADIKIKNIKIKNIKRSIKNFLTSLKIKSSSAYLSLSPSQKIELSSLQSRIQKKSKFSLVDRNAQVVKIQNLTNANLFLASLRNNSNLTPVYKAKTKRKLMHALKAKKINYLKTKQLLRKKLLFIKNKPGKITKIKQNSLFIGAFKTLINVKQPRYTRALIPGSKNSTCLLFTWKIKQLKNFLSTNVEINQNYYHLSTRVQALEIDNTFCFIKITSVNTYISSNLFYLVSAYVLKQTSNNDYNFVNKILLNLTLQKTSLLQSIVAKNNYLSLINFSTPISRDLLNPQLKNLTNNIAVNSLFMVKTLWVEGYALLVNFLNDFSFLKTTKRTNVLSKTSWSVTTPGTVVSTNSLDRNHLAKSTFVPNTKKAVNIANNKFSLLFFQRKIPNYKKLFLLTPQKVSLGSFHKNIHVAHHTSDTHLFSALPKLTEITKQILPSNKSNKSWKSKKNKHLLNTTILLKSTFRLKLQNLKRYMHKRRFKKSLNCLLTLKVLYTTRDFNKNFRKKKKCYARKNQSISFNLRKSHLQGSASEIFFYNYSSIISRKLLLTKEVKACQWVEIPRLQIYKKLARVKKRSKYRRQKNRVKTKLFKQKTQKKNKFGLIRKTKFKKIKKKKITRFIQKKKQFAPKTIILKKYQNKMMTRSKIFSVKNFYLTKSMLLKEKKRIVKLMQFFEYKNCFYRLPRYVKSRLCLVLANFDYPNHKTTRRFKVGKFYCTSTKGDSTTPTLLNTSSSFLCQSSTIWPNTNAQLYTVYNSDFFISIFMQSPFFAKVFNKSNLSSVKNYNSLLLRLVSKNLGQLKFSNIIPAKCFKYILTRKIYNLTKLQTIQENFTPWYYNTLVRFMEHCSGKKCLFQFYPFVNNDVEHEFYVRYKKWIPRMAYYERRLGHRFFLEEAIHIMHLSFFLKDPKLICSWLKAIILRISFWKTRSIFRFLKYLIHNYYIYTFPDLGLKGLKIKLKGKISAAGNSRKRTVLYRVGKTSHSQVSLRVVNEFMTINTFTGVMGFQIWLFY